MRTTPYVGRSNGGWDVPSWFDEFIICYLIIGFILVVLIKFHPTFYKKIRLSISGEFIREFKLYAFGMMLFWPFMWLLDHSFKKGK